MSHKYLTINERNKIEVLNKEDYSSSRIAKILGYHHSTISRELKRCEGNYKAIYADKENHHVEVDLIFGLHKKKTKYS